MRGPFAYAALRISSELLLGFLWWIGNIGVKGAKKFKKCEMYEKCEKCVGCGLRGFH